MISRIMLLTGRRTSIEYFLRSIAIRSTLPQHEPQKKEKFFNPFGDPQDMFYSSDLKKPVISKDLCTETKIETIVKKEMEICVKKEQDECAEKENKPCVKKIQVNCSEKEKNPCGGSDGPPKNPEILHILKRPEFPGKVRLGFIPEEWFTFFYPKTGVTGPYLFGMGLLTFLFSKEIYVMEHEFYTGISLAILIGLIINKLGKPTAVYADKLIDKHEANWDDMHKSDIAQLKKDVDDERKEQWRADGALMLIEAKRQMIDMQLETAYRKEIMDVYKDIINRLDYQVECASVEHRFSHKHMMFWLHDQVANAIKEEQVDDAQREKRKADLSAMVIRIKDYETTADILAGSSFNKAN